VLILLEARALRTLLFPSPTGTLPRHNGLWMLAIGILSKKSLAVLRGPFSTHQT
jgi:hypothetical protein